MVRIEADSLEELRQVVGDDLVALGKLIKPQPARCPLCGKVVGGIFVGFNGFSVHPECYEKRVSGSSNAKLTEILAHCRGVSWPPPIGWWSQLQALVRE